jgi:putative tricarboxylic transport membrane protein
MISGPRIRGPLHVLPKALGSKRGFPVSIMSNQDKRGDSHRSISMKTAEIFVAAVFVVFGLAVAIDSYRLGAQWGTDGPQSGYFPFYIGVMIVAASLVTLVQALLGKAQDGGGIFVEWQALKLVLAVLIPAAGYVLGVQLIGIYLASAVYITGFMVWLGNYTWPKAVVISGVVTVSLYLMFEVWFKVPLFKGSYDLLQTIGL